MHVWRNQNNGLHGVSEFVSVRLLLGILLGRVQQDLVLDHGDL